MKIGVAIIACDRLEYTKKCVESVLANKGPVTDIILVNDGVKIPEGVLPAEIMVMENRPPYQSVGVAKNNALRTLSNWNCDHMFLIENDIMVKSSDVWRKYIDTANATGITHLNFGYHGPANRTPDYTKPNPRTIVEYPVTVETAFQTIESVRVALNMHSVGAFSYYSPLFVKTVGLHDEYFKNAWEHVELCQRAVKLGMLPAFWWFPDVEGSDSLLQEVEGSIKNSSITHTEKWINNMRKGAAHYKKLHGWEPIHTPDTPPKEVFDRLKTIYSKYKK